MALTLMQQANKLGVSSLVYAQRAGWHTLPQDLLDDYASLEALAQQYGTPADPNPVVTEQLAQVVTDRMRVSTAGGAADVLITAHIQPALATFLADFQADIQTAGVYATEPECTNAMLEEPDSVQQAFVRLLESPLRWASIRTSWKILRGRSLAPTRDPAGLDSVHAEVANTLQLRPIWDPHSPANRLATPWNEGVFHLRLKWLLDNGAQIWAPTSTQQTIAWRDNNPELIVR